MKEIRKDLKSLAGAWDTCEACGYDGGFHVIFVREGMELKLKFKCPECRQVYEVDWVHCD